MIIGEWNLNIASNIYKIGNYRYRPQESPTSQYSTLTNSFDENDEGNFYTGATDADIVIDGGFENDNQTPQLFTLKKDKEKLLYSLEECFDRFRPRSGINKLRYFENNYSHHANIDMGKRPRYYMSSIDDKFKYWTSYRTENNIERGIANRTVNGLNYISDAAPFIIYKKSVPTNKIIVKMQTNVGTVDLGPFANSAGSFDDPFYGTSNQTTPTKWKIQYLQNNNWIDAVSFDSTVSAIDELPVVGPDGYVEISYGLKIPETYKNSFIFSGELASTSFLPSSPGIGSAYLVKNSDDDLGVYHIYTSSGYKTFVPQYGWYLSRDAVTDQTSLVTDLTSPSKFIRSSDNLEYYREFQYISGLRVVVEAMNKFDSTFDLIELSPRLAVNLSEKATQFNITKPASDLGVAGMPVGQLLASTGILSIFDYDQAFNDLNKDSLISDFMTKNLQIKFYEVVRNVGNYHYHIPIKTLYAEGFPEISTTNRTVNIQLRDLMFYFEAMTAPELLLQNVSLSSAVSILLDSIGFSNYVFKRNPFENELIIPFFFVSPDTSVAQVLQDLAISTQSAMFFDEENNFVVMSKNYLMPKESERETDIVLNGSVDYRKSGIVKNSSTSTNLANIIEISHQNNPVYNDGLINYTTRYIQKTFGSIKQATKLLKDRTWVYLPTMLWQASGEEAPMSVNDEIKQQSNYALAAVPLNSDLSEQVPSVVNNVITNNTIDFGEAIVYFISRYNGYVYANGEIIRYDAIQFNVSNTNQTSSNVWITNAQEYQNYFSKLPFNGKIYPTGLVRIYAEPNYETINGIERLQNGPVAKHGRGQFGTKTIKHTAGIDSYWTNDANVRGCSMNFEFLTTSTIPAFTDTAAAGVNNNLAKKTTRSGLVRNFLSTPYVEDSQTNRLFSTQSATTQSSALIMNGPSFTTVEKPTDFISYVYKPLENKFKHFGTRMRIVGRMENSNVIGQSAIGSTPYSWTNNNSSPDLNTSINGAGGGLALMVNPETNVGYYFEIIALAENNLESYSSASDLFNVVFYKIKSNTSYDHLATTNLTGNYDGININSIVNDRLRINGVEVSVNDRILLQNQTETTQNGYYIVTSSGSDEPGDTRPWSITRDERAVPIKLWSGLSEINVDDGLFTGQARVTGEENPTVYDLAVEYDDVGSTRRFYLYLNNKLLAITADTDPLPIYNNIGLFVRGSARCMFENVYALTNNYSQNTAFAIDTPVNSAFGYSDAGVSESFRKYAISGMVQSTYLSGISPSQPPQHDIYFEEFGTIMREAAYLNVRYDIAYPALYAQIAKTITDTKGYVISGFMAGAYGAEFLVFNATDTILSLDSSSGNYLKIHGVSFTQESNHQLTVDEYFAKKSDFSNPQLNGSNLVTSPTRIKQQYQDIKNSRTTYGKTDFSLDTPYIQTQDHANDLMAWLVDKIMKPRKSVGVKVFGLPNVQLGDIVKINYQDAENKDLSVSSSSRFVVYNIEYSRSMSGPDITLFLSEVA